MIIAPTGPVLLAPGSTDVSGRMVLVTWVPEANFEALQYVIEIDLKPFDLDFSVDTQRFAYGPVNQALLDSLPPQTEMK